MATSRKAAILVASDLHGGNAAFRKFVGVAKELKPSIAVLAGDLSGKEHVVAVEESGDRFLLRAGGRQRRLSRAELEAERRALGDRGAYLVVSPPAVESPERWLDVALVDAEIKRLRSWLDLWKRHVTTPLVTIGGNDDANHIVSLLREHEASICVEDRVVEVAGWPFFGFGFSTPTGFSTPREMTDGEIGMRLAAIGDTLTNSRESIGVIHCPPHGSHLDFAEVEHNTLLGRVTERTPVGSLSVRSFIERYRPLLVASGHCHDSRGFVKLGETYCVNAGSMYFALELRAAIVSISDGLVACDYVDV